MALEHISLSGFKGKGCEIQKLKLNPSFIVAYLYWVETKTRAQMHENFGDLDLHLDLTVSMYIYQQ